AQPYTERDASGMTFTSQYRHILFGDIPGTEEEWRIDTITDAQWKEMSLRGLTKGSDWSLIRDKNGVRIRYYTRADVIGTAMFADCENLLSLRLPKTITAIEDNAFWKCSCLEHLYLPKGIRNVSNEALKGTPPFLEVHSE
ncbi:MAG: leucine-rich repeat protein, partial [Paludibacteraceae bacterium]|nr:leucine-rich repeat protein [Paludibacteraceae bacterium]